MLSFEDFKKSAQPGGWVSLTAEISADRETSISLLERFKKERHLFLLESVEGGEKWGRYSFLGFSPQVIFKSQGSRVEVIEGGKKRVREAADPLAELRSFFPTNPVAGLAGSRLGGGGAVGFVTYDMVRFFEKLPERTKDDLDLPDLYFVFPQILLVHDNLKHRLQVICNVRIEKGGLRAQYDAAQGKIASVLRQIKRRPALREPRRLKKRETPGGWNSVFSEAEFCRGVEKIKEYVFAGDVTQTVLSNRFSQKATVEPFELYRALRQVNPSPYMFFLQFGDLHLVGASPETMVRLENGEMTLRPIAGTRRRGTDAAQDKILERELLADEKERAEHIMLVDLGRNDLGRVAVPGSVTVDELMTVERYSHVMHIVSNVRAKLAPGRDAFDLLRAAFPAGTLTGSPKVRAMEIIEELESVRRGTYGGSVGYFDFSGNMDMAITIRAALFSKGKIHVQAGAGIVADSQPKMEYQESQNKARGMMEAIKRAARHR